MTQANQRNVFPNPNGGWDVEKPVPIAHLPTPTLKRQPSIERAKSSAATEAAN